MKRWLEIAVYVFIPATIVGVFYVKRIELIWLFGAYGVLSLGRIAFQVLASSYVIRTDPKGDVLRPASLIVAVYNEEPQLFQKAAESFAKIDYPNLEVVIIDDGSDNRKVIEQISKRYGFKYVFQPNAGKRHAMSKGFEIMNPASEIVFTADSDTIWDKKAAHHLATVLYSDDKTGAVTGYVDVLNPRDSWLTYLIYLRYYMALNQERAAQSLFGAVTCVSGPLGAYRRDLIDKIKHNFITQRFLGRECTFGDDRHLTNLILLAGYQVRYAPKAVAYTAAPVGIKEYLIQQTRWGKSHWREMIWQFKALPKQHLYLSYDWLVSLLLPFLLVASIGHYILLALTTSAVWFGYLLLTMIVMSLVRVIDPIIRTKNFAFLLFVIYGFLHLFILLPIKFWSLATINITKWGTR